MIGLSVSGCIAQMVNGDVDPLTVEKIIGSIRAADPETINMIVKDYREGPWIRHPDEAETLFRKMLAEGRIEQPRLASPPRHPMMQPRGNIWVENENDIVWGKHPWD